MQKEESNFTAPLSPFYLNNYYSKIAHLTFRTCFLPISKEEQHMILSFQTSKYKKNSSNLTQSELTVLHSLEEKIEKVLKEFSSPTGVFVKLNFRSPKDGFPLRNDLIQKIFEEEFNKLNEKWDKKLWNLPISDGDYIGNMKWICLYRAQERMACCKETAEIMNLLLSSIRICEDLECFLKEKEEVFLAFREFNPDIRGIYEFRCFVKENELKSITQYNHPWLVQELLNADFCEKLKFAILEYWTENLKEVLKDFNNYVFDLALLIDGINEWKTDGRIKKNLVLIELNPIETSGKGLFKGDEMLNTKDVVLRVRNNLEIPYKEHWEYLEYMIVDMIQHEGYQKFVKNQEKQLNEK